MEPLVSRFAARAAPNSRIWTCGSCRVPSEPHSRSFTTSIPKHIRVKQNGSGGDPYRADGLPGSSHSQPAANLSQNVSQGEKEHFTRIEEESKEKQMRSPWMRDGSDKPPVATLRQAGAMTKGKLLTTPSRMLKLILPLTTRDVNNDRKDVEPLALLVHPQQPLSYLERLIQSELPGIKQDGKERPPNIVFRAQNNAEEDIGRPASKRLQDDEHFEEEAYDFDQQDETVIDGKPEKTGKLRSASQRIDEKLPMHGHAQEQPYKTSDPEHPNFVRWSPSTEMGDFIRDAARGKEFAVDIEGAHEAIYVGVPSFQDRTYYLRMRLRKTARRISDLADIKRECDKLAHQGAQRVAQLGFTGLIGWWGMVYYLTFHTDLGWDVMEPVTYLVGLSGLMSGYMWFLYNNREVSYKSAMNFTVSRRQSQLYDAKGFNVSLWEGLVDEGNRLRREIKMVADEYDVEWDEAKDEGDEKVAEELRKQREKKNGNGKQKEGSDDGEDDS